MKLILQGIAELSFVELSECTEFVPCAPETLGTILAAMAGLTMFPRKTCRKLGFRFGCHGLTGELRSFQDCWLCLFSNFCSANFVQQMLFSTLCSATFVQQTVFSKFGFRFNSAILPGPMYYWSCAPSSDPRNSQGQPLSDPEGGLRLAYGAFVGLCIHHVEGCSCQEVRQPQQQKKVFHCRAAFANSYRATGGSITTDLETSLRFYDRHPHPGVLEYDQLLIGKPNPGTPQLIMCSMLNTRMLYFL